MPARGTSEVPLVNDIALRVNNENAPRGRRSVVAVDVRFSFAAYEYRRLYFNAFDSADSNFSILSIVNANSHAQFSKLNLIISTLWAPHKYSL